MSSGSGPSVAPLRLVSAAEDQSDNTRRLTLTCGHVVVRRAYMGGTYARARCPFCPRESR